MKLLYNLFLSFITLKRHSALSRSTWRPFGPELKAAGLSTGSWPRGSVGVTCWEGTFLSNVYQILRYLYGYFCYIWAKK